MAKTKLRIEESFDGGKTWTPRDGVFNLEDQPLLESNLKNTIRQFPRSLFRIVEFDPKAEKQSENQ